MIWPAKLTFLLVLLALPTLIASVRQRPEIGAIAVWNLLAGWTVIGWIGLILYVVSVDNIPDEEKRV